MNLRERSFIIPCVKQDGKEDVIQYAFRNGQIVKAATGDALGEHL
jgi:hypothetical protein